MQLTCKKYTIQTYKLSFFVHFYFYLNLCCKFATVVFWTYFSFSAFVMLMRVIKYEIFKIFFISKPNVHFS